MQLRSVFVAVVVSASLLLAPLHHASAQQSFRDLVGNVTAAPVEKTKTLNVPYLTWGGDVATFWPMEI